LINIPINKLFKVVIFVSVFSHRHHGKVENLKKLLQVVLHDVLRVHVQLVAARAPGSIGAVVLLEWIL
jgi:hypothetical protein